MTSGADYFEREYFVLHAGKRRYLDFLLGELRRAGVRRGDVLDVGSGFGFFLEALASDGHRPFGIELSPYAAACARVRTPGRQVAGSAERPLPFADRSFDAVTLLDVIEHVEDHVGALRECARVLRPGGRVLLVTLNRWSAARPLLGKRWSWYQDPTHVHMFSIGSLRRALDAAGFDCARTATLWNFCSVGETTRLLRPLRRVGRVVRAPAFGDAILLDGVLRS